MLAFAAGCTGIATYSVMDAVMKALSIESGAYSALLWRSIAGVVLTGAIFLARRQRWPGPAALKLHVARGLVTGGSVLLFFWGLVHVPMAQAVALTFLAPLIALFLAGALLGEQVGRGAVIGSLAASGGVLMIAAGQVRGGGGEALWLGSGAVVLASILYAYSLILLRQQAQAASPLEVTFFTSVVLGAALLLGAPWLAVAPSMAQLPWVVVAAAIGSLSAFLMAWAYAHAEAQLLSMVEYTAFIWAAILGYLVFGEAVSLFTVAGAVLIVGGCAIAVRGTSTPAPMTEAAA
ncbi:DMT family transporter [Sphingomonas sp.]|uniref:DMT family transporter n=1 Tax=Sphingomonas sp. TaxID=28214 RepID=UPI001DD6CF14|nr:DMT family transporter [Sphingomonas sp.]MBX9797656.1 DMT family transporter [Sphingomonas sp.]